MYELPQRKLARTVDALLAGGAPLRQSLQSDDHRAGRHLVAVPRDLRPLPWDKPLNRASIRRTSISGAGAGDDGDRPERFRQYLFLDRHRQGAGEYRRYAMPPLTAHELTLAIAFGGVTRGLAVGLAAA